MIFSPHEASLLPSCVDARRLYGHADSQQLFNAANANFGASRPLPKPFAQRPGTRKSGTDSHRDVTNRRVAGVGNDRSKNYRQHGRRSDGDLGLHLLRHLSVLSIRALGRIFRGALVRSILLFVVPAKYPLSWQARHFRPRQSGVVSIRHIALERVKNSVALSHLTDEYSSGSNQWLTAHFDSSSMLLNKRAS
jgi:hypothetical protein